MRVLVTGGAGFLGSHLVDMMLAAGHSVAVLDDLSTGSIANLRPAPRLFKMDVRDSLHSVLDGIGPEVVVHLAAQVSVPESVNDPSQDLSVNVGGTVNLISTAAKVGVKKVILVSSAAVYGVPDRLPITEETVTAPVSPYGLSKLCAEQYVRLLGDLLGIEYTIIRPSNIYGPRQAVHGEGAVIPSFINRFLSGRDPILHGDGSQTRDFIYVADLARAILLALDHGDGLTLNVSYGSGVSVKELWEKLANLLGWERTPVFGPPRVGDILHSVMANDAARRSLGWQPQVSLADGLVDTVGWHLRAEVAATRE